MREHRSGRQVLAATALLLAVLAAASGARAAKGDCGQPQSTGTKANASDCAYILQAAVGSKPCDLCVCNVNNASGISSVDALLCLKFAVGQGVTLSCPSCSTVTTTTTLGTNSTVTSSTTSSTTTIPVHCSSNSDCSALPSGFRCNPNNDECEKPCTKNTDCHDFYECNTTTHYCQEPALLF